MAVDKLWFPSLFFSFWMMLSSALFCADTITAQYVLQAPSSDAQPLEEDIVRSKLDAIPDLSYDLSPVLKRGPLSHTYRLTIQGSPRQAEHVFEVLSQDASIVIEPEYHHKVLPKDIP